MNPGLGTVCSGCRHFSASGWHQGHVNPCGQNRWDGERHHSPAIAADGKSCEDFVATPAVDSTPDPCPSA